MRLKENNQLDIFHFAETDDDDVIIKNDDGGDKIDLVRCQGV